MLSLFFALVLLAGQSGPVVSVRPQSAMEEADYAWGVVRDIAFFEKNGYQVSLPAVEGLEDLKQRARQGGLTEGDRSSFGRRFQTIYSEDAYRAAIDVVSNRLDRVRAGVAIIERYVRAGVVKGYPAHTVKLTLYGSGGSYNPVTGDIVLLATRAGTFKGGRAPEEIILHEIVHLALEDLVQKFRLTHVEKERLVDLFCQAHFRDLLPAYRVQDMGFDALDHHLTTPDAWMRLPDVLAAYKRE